MNSSDVTGDLNHCAASDDHHALSSGKVQLNRQPSSDPGSPLALLDPSQLRELVERQQHASTSSAIGMPHQDHRSGFRAMAGSGGPCERINLNSVQVSMEQYMLPAGNSYPAGRADPSVSQQYVHHQQMSVGQPQEMQRQSPQAAAQHHRPAPYPQSIQQGYQRVQQHASVQSPRSPRGSLNSPGMTKQQMQYYGHQSPSFPQASPTGGPVGSPYQTPVSHNVMSPQQVAYMQQQRQQQQQQSYYVQQQQTSPAMPPQQHPHAQQQTPDYLISPHTPQGRLQQQPPAPSPRQQHEATAPAPMAFYGHDPNVLIHEDLCLVGCIFLVVDYERSLDQKEVADWRLCVAQHGGDIESSYNANVTHVLCETLRHPVVQQALRDGKRCVTAQWLSDCLLAKRMQPPWKAIHFPTSFGETKPCKDKIFAVSGFEDNERCTVKQMISAVGGRYTSYLCRKNYALIAKVAEGPKVARAVEWGIPVLNVHWLTDIMMGNVAATTGPVAPKHRIFHLPTQWRVDPSAAMHLMNAWRTPIAVPPDVWKASAERKQRLDNDDGKVFPFKKLRLSPIPDDFEMEPGGRTLPDGTVPRICFTGLYPAEMQNLSKKTMLLGGELTDDVCSCTHIVAADVKRTLKILKGITVGKPVVSPTWIRQSVKQRKWIGEGNKTLSQVYSFPAHDEFFVKDEGNERFFGFNLKLSIRNGRKKRLFENVMFHLTPSILPSLSAVREIVEAAGGCVLNQRPPSKEILQLKERGVVIVIISCDADLHLCENLFRQQIAVHSAEFVLTGVLRQEVDFSSYRIEPKQPNNSSR